VAWHLTPASALVPSHVHELLEFGFLISVSLKIQVGECPHDHGTPMSVILGRRNFIRLPLNKVVSSYSKNLLRPRNELLFLV